MFNRRWGEYRLTGYDIKMELDSFLEDKKVFNSFYDSSGSFFGGVSQKTKSKNRSKNKLSRMSRKKNRR